jgi:hypothetical protein
LLLRTSAHVSITGAPNLLSHSAIVLPSAAALARTLSIWSFIAFSKNVA